MKIIFKVSTLLIFGLLLLGIADYFIPDSSLFQDYIRGSFTEIVGIVLTLILIEIILANNRKKEQKEIAKKGMKRAIKMIQISLVNYNYAAFEITTRLKEAGKKKKHLSQNFAFSELADLFHVSITVFDGFSSSKADVYFDRLDRLIETVRSVLYQVDISNYSELSESLLGMLEYIDSFYPKNSILSDKTSKMGDKLMTDYISETISNCSDVPDYNVNTFLDKYIRLYKIIGYLNKFSNDFHALSKKIDDES